MFKCKCGKSHTKLPKADMKNGTHYVIMFDCDKCNRTIGIEGVKGVKPPKLMTK